MQPREALKKYWNHDNFRPLQEEIIESILNNYDTLALLPTGGGKSVCFQVPAMCSEGVCIVISPLISLMTDQVDGLKRKGIKAESLISGKSHRQIDIILDNCIYGNTKFLYMSPERLKSDLVIARLKMMKICFVAVDEAHCISQWGYDFRPSYLEIKQLKELLPKTPFIALTATATDRVAIDIQAQLGYDLSKAKAFRKSFTRPNLSYNIHQTENKQVKLIEIFTKMKGSGIVYTRNRKQTELIAAVLNGANISAEFYHAGIKTEVRNQKQVKWLQNKTRVMVATNAFGMGIDKPDVRIVVHLDIPSNLENYYQEAGRAGRDEQKAYAVLLHHKTDSIRIKEQFELSYPTLQEIRQIYQQICSQLQLAYGAGLEERHPFDVRSFGRKNKIPFGKVIHALKFLEKDEYISLSEGFGLTSTLQIITSPNNIELITSAKLLLLCQTIIRSYTGTFHNQKKISESDLAERCDISINECEKLLNKLHSLEIINYQKENNAAVIYFIKARVQSKDLLLSTRHYKERKETTDNQLRAVLNFVSQYQICRERLILEYFDQTAEHHACGNCDVCRKADTSSKSDGDYVLTEIKNTLASEPLTTYELADRLEKHDNIIEHTEWLLSNDELLMGKDGRLKVK